MPTVAFTHTLQRHVEALLESVQADNVNDALAQVFSNNPKLRNYILEDDGSVRKHIAIWVAGQPLRDRVSLSDKLEQDDEVYVMQALSGG